MFLTVLFMVNLTFITNTITENGIACEQSSSLFDPIPVFCSASTPRSLLCFALFRAYHVVITSTGKPLSSFVHLSVSKL